jgi:death-on-curing protein
MIPVDPIWIDSELVEAIHERQLAEHGGGAGVRDAGMLESALARPQQRLVYGGTDVDIPTLAAAYAFGLARNHPFVELNGYLLLPDDATLYPVFLGLAAGELEERELADWLRANSRPEQVSERGGEYG